jgi:4-diphosphocytidyl-2-C-methyl-D-erythritol kinase
LPDRDSETARAKVNLYLHVLGRRADGYHALQSLVAFADCGDTVTVTGRADRWSLAIDGPMAGPLAGEATDDNLVLRALRRWQPPGDPAAALRLTKRLPVAAGIGGGSADAAAALRCLARLRCRDPGDPADWADLGADIPVCLLQRPALVEGMGERLTPLAQLPDLPAVLVNPGQPSATAAVFAALAGRYGPPLANPLPDAANLATPDTLARWLAGARNDLTPPAIECLPAVAEVLAALAAAPGCRLARMSGSGATCFGLFATASAATAAGRWLAARAPGWWIVPTRLCGWPEAA